MSTYTIKSLWQLPSNSLSKQSKLVVSKCASNGGNRQLTCAATASSTEHARYIQEVALLPEPKRLDSLLKVLEAQGHSIVPPAVRDSLHPLFVPLSKGPYGSTSGSCTPPHSPNNNEVMYVGLLRWHNPQEHKAMESPVVSQSPGGRSLTLLARSPQEYVHRALVEEDYHAGGGPIASSLGQDTHPDASSGDISHPLYVAGDVKQSQLSSLDAYITRKVGMFPDVMENLVEGHLVRGDSMAAMVAAEWYMRNNHFSGWARPYEYNSQLFLRSNRKEEARDTARIALRLPWWTMESTFDDLKAVAGLSGDAATVSHMLNDESGAAQRAQQSGYQKPKGPKQVALEHAFLLMNQVAATESSWDDIRQPLADSFREAGYADVASFLVA